MKSFGEFDNPCLPELLKQQALLARGLTIAGSNSTFVIESSISPELKVDQSLSHNGVCLTVEEVHQNKHRVTAIEETLKKTNLGQWKTGRPAIGFWNVACS